jgi:hypothetical protein
MNCLLSLILSQTNSLSNIGCEYSLPFNKFIAIPAAYLTAVVVGAN